MVRALALTQKPVTTMGHVVTADVSMSLLMARGCIQGVLAFLPWSTIVSMTSLSTRWIVWLWANWTRILRMYPNDKRRDDFLWRHTQRAVATGPWSLHFDARRWMFHLIRPGSQAWMQLPPLLQALYWPNFRASWLDHVVWKQVARLAMLGRHFVVFLHTQWADMDHDYPRLRRTAAQEQALPPWSPEVLLEPFARLYRQKPLFALVTRYLVPPHGLHAPLYSLHCLSRAWRAQASPRVGSYLSYWIGGPQTELMHEASWLFVLCITDDHWSFLLELSDLVGMPGVVSLRQLSAQWCSLLHIHLRV